MDFRRTGWNFLSILVLPLKFSQELEFIVRNAMGQTVQLPDQNGEYMEAFSVRLLNALGRKEAEQICREHQWFGVLRQINATKD